MPKSVDFTITGYNRVRNQLRAAASFYDKQSDKAIEKHAKREAKNLRSKPYPATLPNQKYIRTFELQRKFRAQRRGISRWAVINRRPGAVWVIKKGMQNRKVHLGRWWTIEDTLQATIPPLTKELSTQFEGLIERQRDN